MSFVSTIALPNENEPAVTQTVSLEGRSYVFTLDWNSRTDRWTISLATEAGQEVLNGALLQVGIDILRTIPNTLDYVPPGRLYLGGTDDPTLVSMPSVALFYVPSDL